MNCKIHTDIVQLESILTNHRDEYPDDQLAEMEEDLRQFTYLEKLWLQFRSVRLDRDTRVLKEKFHPIDYEGNPSQSEKVFNVGTPEAAVLSWFETRFSLSVHEEFGYDGPWEPGASCDGCVLSSREKGMIPSDCLRCRRQYPGQEAFEQKPDLYSPEKTVAKPVVRAVPTPSCDIEVKVDTPFSVTINLKENDIFNWLTWCQDKDALLRLSKYAASCARSIDAPDDDFRSRA